MFRIYWTPLHLYRKGLSKTTCCWRCNKDNASLKHMFLQCAVLSKFWEKVVDHINVTVWQKLKFSEDNILLNYIPSIWNLTTGLCKWILHALPMAKRLILQHWKDKCIFTQRIEDPITLATYERIAYRHRLCKVKYNEIWDSFLQIV